MIQQNSTFRGNALLWELLGSVPLSDMNHNATRGVLKILQSNMTPHCANSAWLLVAVKTIYTLHVINIVTLNAGLSNFP